jgi:hypothetical protein
MVTEKILRNLFSKEFSKGLLGFDWAKSLRLQMGQFHEVGIYPIRGSYRNVEVFGKPVDLAGFDVHVDGIRLFGDVLIFHFDPPFCDTFKVVNSLECFKGLDKEKGNY